MQNYNFPSFIVISVFLSNIIFSFAQTNKSEYYDQLVSALIKNDSSLVNFTSSDLIRLSNRLGIEYNDVVNKFMISYEPLPGDQEEKKLEIISTHKVNEIDSIYKILFVEFGDNNQSKKYILKNDSLYSPVLFYTKDWIVKESEHFRFLISDSSNLNEYAIRKLEESYKIISTLFEYTEEQENLISKNKILYILCSNETEVELLTGHRARGIYHLAYDAIITSYNSHYHELVHLLVNFRLKRNYLYTHPFLMEGIAVALGGRGGIHQRILLETGVFLFISEFAELEEIVSTEDFRKTDPSISYALSGIYCYYLLHKVGVDSFFAIYKNYSGNYEEVRKMRLQLNTLPSTERMINFIEEHFPKQILFDKYSDDMVKIFSDNENIILESETNYFFLISSPLLLSTEFIYPNYKSNKVKELKLDKNYKYEHYLIICSESEIAVYDLLLNMLIHSYVQEFDFRYQQVPRIGKHYSFSIPKSYMKIVF